MHLGVPYAPISTVTSAPKAAFSTVTSTTPLCNPDVAQALVYSSSARAVPGDRSHSAWQALGADEICPLPGCRFQVCRCAIGVVLDANMDPVEPYRAARLEDC